MVFFELGWNSFTIPLHPKKHGIQLELIVGLQGLVLHSVDLEKNVSLHVVGVFRFCVIPLHACILNSCDDGMLVVSNVKNSWVYIRVARTFGFWMFPQLGSHAALSCCTHAFELISWMKPTPCTHATICLCPFISNAHASMPCSLPPWPTIMPHGAL